MPRFASIPDQESYFRKVWALVRTVPPGRLVTYGQIAFHVLPSSRVDAAAYRVFGPRWVGSAMAHCPPDVPWQRVVNAQGTISTRPGAELQRELLVAEGVQFSSSGKIDLKVYGWDFQD